MCWSGGNGTKPKEGPSWVGDQPGAAVPRPPGEARLATGVCVTLDESLHVSGSQNFSISQMPRWGATQHNSSKSEGTAA